MAGVDLNTVRELLGHKTIAMTLRYAHLAPEHTTAAVESLVKGGGRRPKAACRGVLAENPMRTPVKFSRAHAFQACAIDHSAISPI